jgi:hypothetical protein
MTLVFTPDQSGDAANVVALASGFYLLAGTLTFSGSYATGGDALDLGLKNPQVGRARMAVVVGQLRGNIAEYDPTNKKLKLYSSANTELTAAAYNAALTATPVPIAFLMKGA